MGAETPADAVLHLALARAAKRNKKPTARFRTRTGPASQQFGDRLRIVEDADGASARFEELQLWIDAEDLVDGGVNIGRSDGPCVRALAEAVGGTDDLAALHAAAAHKAEHRVAPVIAAGRALAHRRAAVTAIVHLGSSAKLAAQNHKRGVE